MIPFYFSRRCCLVTSAVSDSVIQWTVAPQAPLSLGFSSQEYWSGILCPGVLPHPGMKPESSVSPTLQADS